LPVILEFFGRLKVAMSKPFIDVASRLPNLTCAPILALALIPALCKAGDAGSVRACERMSRP